MLVNCILSLKFVFKLLNEYMYYEFNLVFKINDFTLWFNDT